MAPPPLFKKATLDISQYVQPAPKLGILKSSSPADPAAKWGEESYHSDSGSSHRSDASHHSRSMSQRSRQRKKIKMNVYDNKYKGKKKKKAARPDVWRNLIDDHRITECVETLNRVLPVKVNEVTLDQFQFVMKELKVELNEEEVKILFQFMDLDHSNTLSKGEIVKECRSILDRHPDIERPAVMFQKMYKHAEDKINTYGGIDLQLWKWLNRQRATLSKKIDDYTQVEPVLMKLIHRDLKATHVNDEDMTLIEEVIGYADINTRKLFKNVIKLRKKEKALIKSVNEEWRELRDMSQRMMDTEDELYKRQNYWCVICWCGCCSLTTGGLERLESEGGLYAAISEEAYANHSDSPIDMSHLQSQLGPLNTINSAAELQHGVEIVQ